MFRLIASVGAVLIPGAALAESWDSGGVNSNWSLGTNWNTNIAPANDGTATIFFGTGSNLTPNIDVPWSIRSLTFNPGAPAFTIGGSTLTIQADGLTNRASNTQTLATVALGDDQTWDLTDGNLTLTGNLNNSGNDLTVSGSGNLALHRALIGAGALTKLGSGTLTLGNGTADAVANTISGLITVSGGTLILDKAAGTLAIPHDLIVNSGGTVTANRSGQFSANSNLTLNGGVINFGTSATIGSLTAYSGGYSTSGNGPVTFLGTSQFALSLGGSLGVSGLNLFSVTGGGVTLLNNNAFSSTIGGPVNLGGVGREFNVSENASGDDLIVSGVVSSGGVLKTGPGTLALSNASNSYSLGTTIKEGEVHAYSDGALGAAGAGVSINGGVFQNGPALVATARPFAFGAGGGAIDTQSGNLTLAGLISGSGPIYKWNSNTLTIGGGAADTTPNTYSGSINISGGMLTLDKAVGTLALGGDISLTGFGGLTTTHTGLVSPTANVYMSTSGTLNLADFTTIGTLSVYAGGGSTTSTILLTSTAPTALTVGAGIGLANSFEFLGSTGGGITLANNGPYASTISGTVYLGLQRTITVPDNLPGDDLTLSGLVFGGAINKVGAGTLALTTANSLSSISISEGTVRAPSASALSYGSITIANLGTLETSSSFTLNQPIQTNGSIMTDSGTILTISAPITGTSLTKTGPGELLLFNSGNSASFTTIESGTLTLSGGLISGTLINNATFKYLGGSIAGQVSNNGNMILGSSLTLPMGLLNDGSLNVPSNVVLTVNATGLNNFGNLSLSGGDLDGSGMLTNWGSFTGGGTITLTGSISNIGLLSPSGLMNFIGNTAISNSGQIQVPAGAQIGLSGTTLSNVGTVSLGGGTIFGSSQITNFAGGTITGHGVITTPFSNSGGSIAVTDGTLSITSPFANTGAITLAGITASLTGGAITNTGSVQGFGSIANTINNNAGGSIEAMGGTLNLSAATSTSAGLISASAGSKVLFSLGLPANSGVISLSGGTFDNNGHPTTNFGQITGYGTFRSGGLTNNGSVTITGGVSTINGDVTNNATHKFEVANNPAIFTGQFTNFGIFKNTKTTVTFAGGYVEHGQFISDPADNIFVSVTIASDGAWHGGLGDRFIINQDLLNESSQRASWSTAQAELDFAGSANHIFSTPAEDLGPTYAGYQDNFAWGVLRLDPLASLTLMDSNLTPGAAIYVSQLALGGGFDQINSITGNGVNIYYDAANPANAYLDARTYPLAGGGVIAAVPEPSCLLPLLLGGLFAIRQRRRPR